MISAIEAATVANRFGYGARPGELASLGSGARDALSAQLHGPPPVIGDGLKASHQVLAQAIELREQSRGSEVNDATAQVTLGMRLRELNRPIYEDEALARFSAAATSQRSFIERLVQFWSNHFAVSIDKVAVLGIAGAMEREAIRPNVLGNFTDLLFAVERHPAMLLYLDNHLSAGPNSPAASAVAKRGNGRTLGLNENLAREILELHTLGVDGGYTQQDVASFAGMITGWSIGGDVGRLRGGDAGKFYFRENFHEPGGKVLLGKTYRQDGIEQGEHALRDLAALPATARHIATKLARHFIADEPPAAVVERLAKVFLGTQGDLPTLYRALIDAPQSWQKSLSKFKTPAEFIYSTYRGLALPVENVRRALGPFEALGQRNFQPGSPAGWPDRSVDWDGSSALLKRIEWADALGQRMGSRFNAARLADAMLGATLGSATRTSIARAQDGAQALTLLLSSPEFMRR